MEECRLSEPLEFSPEGNSQMSAHRRFLFASCLAVSTLCWRLEAQISIVVSQPPPGQTATVQPQAGKLTLAAAIDAAEANYPRTRVALEQRNAAQAAIGVAQFRVLSAGRRPLANQPCDGKQHLRPAVAARRHSLDLRPGDCEQQHALSMEQRRGHPDFMATI